MTFAEIGGGGLAVGGVFDGSRGSRSAPRIAPELAGCSDVSSVGPRKKSDFWVQQGLPEVGEVFVAPRAEWKVLVDFWMSGEGC